MSSICIFKIFWLIYCSLLQGLWKSGRYFKMLSRKESSLHHMPKHGIFITVTEASPLKTFKSWVLCNYQIQLISFPKRQKKKTTNQLLMLFPDWLNIFTEVHYYLREFTLGMHTNEHQSSLYRFLQISVGLQVSNEMPGAWIPLLFWFYNSEIRIETSCTGKEKFPLALMDF